MVVSSIPTTASPFDDRPISAFQLKVFVLCFLIAVLDGFDIQAIAFAAPAIGETMGVPKETFGMLFSVGIVGMLIGLLIQGPIADRAGRRPLLIISVGVFGFATLCTAASTNVPMLVATRLIAGLGLGAAVPNAVALTAEYAPARARARLIVAMNAGLLLGGFLGGLFSAHLIAAYGWQSIFVVGGGLPLVLVPVLLISLPESIVLLQARNRRAALDALLVRANLSKLELPVISPSSSRPSMSQLFLEGRASATTRLWLLFFLNMLLFYVLIAWLPTLLITAGLPTPRAFLVTAGLNFGGVIGGIALAWLADRSGAKRSLLIAFGAGAATLLTLGLLEIASFGVIAILAGTLGVATGGAQLLMNAVAAEFYPVEIRSTGVGMAGLAGRVGAIIGPVIVGLLVSAGAEPATVYTLLAAPALAAVALAASMQSRRLGRSVS